MSKIVIAMWILGMLLVPLAAAASCASGAYQKTCSSCPFDADGKIDQSCSGGYKASGTACVSTSYPIMATKYAAGKCPAVDGCASELQSCVTQYSTGNDKADCTEGSVAICYAAADECTKKAAITCGEIETGCPGSSTAFILLFAGLFFVRMRNKTQKISPES